MGMNQFLNENLLLNLAPPTVAGTTTITSAAVDMANGANSVVFEVEIATHASGNYIKVQESDTTTDGDYSDIAGSKTIGLADADIVAVEIFKPAKRYLRAQVVRGTSSALGPILGVQQMQRVTPPSGNNVTGVVSQILITPALGTA